MPLSTPDSPQELLEGDAAPPQPPAAANRLDRLPRAALWVALGRGLGIASTVLATIAVPRLLAPREFGELTSLLSIISFGAIVAQFGLGHTSVRFLAECLALHDRERIRRTLQLARRILTISSLAVVGLASLVLWGWGEAIFQLRDVVWLTPLAAALIVLMAWQQLSAESLRGLHEIRWASLLSGGTFGGPLPVLIFLALLAAVSTQGHPAITTTLICQIIGSGVSLLTAVLCLRWTVQAISGGTDVEPACKLAGEFLPADFLRVCLPMALFQFFVIIVQTADIWMAAWFLPLEGVALYGAARRYLVLLNVPTQLAVNTVVSSIPDLYVRGRLEEMETLLRRSATLAGLSTLAISLLCIFAGGWLMGALSGSFYQEGATALAILSVGPIVASLTGYGGMTLAMTGRQNAAMWICLCSAAFLCIAGPLAAQRWGISGIAAASAGATALQAILEWLVCRRLVGIWTHADPRRLVS